MMHTHQVAHLPQSNGGSGLNDDSDTWRHLASADLHASVNPDKSTMKIVMAAMSSRSMYAFMIPNNRF